MGKKKTATSNIEKINLPPAKSPEEQEQRMIMLAMAQAERDLMNGTASSQVVCHYLKLASSKERAEKKKIEEETKLLKAKSKSIESAERIEKLYSEAIDAMKEYSGKRHDDYSE